MVDAKEKATPVGILKKIAAVQEGVGNIPKNGTGPSTKGSYAYVKYDDVLLAVRDLFVKLGVVVEMTTIDHVVNSQIVGNRSVVNTSIKVQYAYTDIEDGSRHVTVVGGEGSDIGSDTATRKAYTQAQKIALLQTFNIFTGDEPDSDGDAQAEIPVPKAAAQPTKTEQGISSVRDDITAIISSEDNSFDGVKVNALGDEVTGKPSSVWGADVTSLRKILKELQSRVTAEQKTGEIK